MQLLWDILAALSKRLLIAGLLFFVVIGALFVYSQIRPAIATQFSQLDQMTQDLDRKARQMAIIQANRLSIERQILMLEANQPAWYQLQARAEYELTHRVLLEARDTQQALFDSTLSAYRDLSRQAQLLAQSFAARSRDAVSRHWKTALLAVALFFIAPLIWKVAWYYGFGAMLPFIRPIKLVDATLPGQLQAIGRPEKSLRIELQNGERLAARMEWVHEYPSEAKKKTRLLWKLHAPMVSYVAGLSELTEISVADDSDQRAVVLSSGEDADRYIAQVSLVDHPGFVFRPQNIIAVSETGGQLRIRTQWRLLNLHALLTWQFRYILLSGTGRVYLAGLGGIESRESSADGTCVDQRLTAGFDGRVSYGVRRTETFWPYLRGRTSLLDDVFIGKGLYFRSLVFGGRMNAQFTPESWAGRMLAVVGKFLGF